MEEIYTAAKVGCVQCPALVECRTHIVDGAGSAAPLLMCVAEAPGADEDRAATPFVGKSGQLLRATISESGLNSTRVYHTNVLKCRPPDNRDPTPEEMSNCAVWLEEEIRRLQPKFILCLGKIARAQLASIVAGWGEPFPATVLEVTHPAATLHSPRLRDPWKAQMRAALDIVMGRPRTMLEIKVPDPYYEGEPDWGSHYLAIDTETDDLEESWDKKMVCYQISDGICTQLYTDPFDLWMLGHRRIAAHNIKYDAPHLGFDLSNTDRWEDTALRAYVLRYPRVGLKELGPLLTGIPMPSIHTILKYRGLVAKELKAKCPDCKGKSMDSPPCGSCRGTGHRWKVTEKTMKRSFGEALRDDPDAARDYALRDPVVTSRLEEYLRAELEMPGNERLLTYYNEIEKPLVPVLLDMEQRGVMIDTANLGPLAAELKAEIEKYETAIRLRLHGDKDFNPFSNQQLAEQMIAEGYKLTALTDTGQWKMDKEIFLKLAGVTAIEDVPEDTLSYEVLTMRIARKLYTTYVIKLLEWRDSAGRLHTRFNQMVAGTNRLSSSDPNLQNIPIRGTIGKSLRRTFVASPGKVLVKGDASQLEVRLFAHYTHDPVLCSAYLHTDHNEDGKDGACTRCDVHQQVADALGIPRWRAKNTLFSAVYGAAEQKLAQTAGVSLADAGPFLRQLKERMPCLVTWQKHIAALLTRDGYIETWLGWRNYYPQFWSPLVNESKAALREAANCPIQGTASGLIKVLMIRAAMLARAWGASALIQVHDEMVYEIHPDQAAGFGKALAALFTQIGVEYGITIPLILNVETGPNWGDTIPLAS